VWLWSRSYVLIREREYIEKGESEGKTFSMQFVTGDRGMQDFDSVIRRMIEAKQITLEDGLSYDQPE
jgi:hypothetical protein